MKITANLLIEIYHCPSSRAARFAAPLDKAMRAYDINTKARVSQFLSHIGHESGRLRYTSELWGPTKQQKKYDIASGSALSHALGNVHIGDGSKYRGHGLLQTTGRGNHVRVRDRLRKKFTKMNVPDFEAYPELLSQPVWACLSACDYWDMRNLNYYADRHAFVTITRRINGGTNGLADRKQLLIRAEAALNDLPVGRAIEIDSRPTSQPIMFFERAM